jgi:hypothetical protein
VVALAQLVFLVLFSYSFFYPGYTGLAITIGAVLTLAVLMHLTAGVNWDERLGPTGTKDYPPTPGIALPSRLARARGRDLNHHPLPHEDEGAGHTEA